MWVKYRKQHNRETNMTAAYKEAYNRSIAREAKWTAEKYGRLYASLSGSKKVKLGYIITCTYRYKCIC